MPVLKALLAQLAGIMIVLLIGRSGMLPHLSPFALAGIQGCAAAFIGASLRLAKWWIPINLCLLPCVVLASQLGLPAWIYFLGFAGLYLIFWTSFRTQVPLFLSNRITVHKLAAWLPCQGSLKVMDVGSGTGSFVTRLARLRPDWAVSGVETAPLPFLLSRWLARNIPNAVLRRGDLWAYSLNNCDVVYAFLSPVPMRDLWRKASREMRPGTWLISNSFPVPNLSPTKVLSVNDGRASTLYCYLIPNSGKTADS